MPNDVKPVFLPPTARDLLDAALLFAAICVSVTVAYAGLVVSARVGRWLLHSLVRG